LAKGDPAVIPALISLQADKIAATTAVIEGRPSYLDLITGGVGTAAAVAGGGFLSIGISGGAFGYTVGTIFNQNVLSNPYFFANGNPVENLFCHFIFGCGSQSSKAMLLTSLGGRK